MRTLLAAFLLAAGMLAAGDAPAQPTPTYRETSARTKEVGERYFAAYIAKDWATVGELLAENGSFADRTAELVFGSTLQQGRAATLAFFGKGYEGVQMRYRPTRAIHTGHHAVYEGSLDWTLRLGDGRTITTEAMPFVVILRVEAGRVVEHRDYADYHPFVENLRRTPRPGSAGTTGR